MQVRSLSQTTSARLMERLAGRKGKGITNASECSLCKAPLLGKPQQTEEENGKEEQPSAEWSVAVPVLPSGPCHHYFHKRCLLGWCEESVVVGKGPVARCPQCQGAIVALHVQRKEIVMMMEQGGQETVKVVEPKRRRTRAATATAARRGRVVKQTPPPEPPPPPPPPPPPEEVDDDVVVIEDTEEEEERGNVQVMEGGGQEEQEEDVEMEINNGMPYPCNMGESATSYTCPKCGETFPTLSSRSIHYHGLCIWDDYVMI